MQLLLSPESYHIPNTILARTLVFPIRLTPQERDKLESYAQQQGISSAEVIRDYIKSLPKKPVAGTLSPTQPC